jgi:hypothetical protein
MRLQDKVAVITGQDRASGERTRCDSPRKARAWSWPKSRKATPVAPGGKHRCPCPRSGSTPIRASSAARPWSWRARADRDRRERDTSRRSVPLQNELRRGCRRGIVTGADDAGGPASIPASIARCSPTSTSYACKAYLSASSRGMVRPSCRAASGMSGGTSARIGRRPRDSRRCSAALGFDVFSRPGTRSAVRLTARAVGIAFAAPSPSRWSTGASAKYASAQSGTSAHR